VTERTYWLLIILFISLDQLAKIELAKRKKPAVKANSRRSRYYPQPERRHAPPVMPFTRE
jgi:hypothetical protein